MPKTKKKEPIPEDGIDRLLGAVVGSTSPPPRERHPPRAVAETEVRRDETRERDELDELISRAVEIASEQENIAVWSPFISATLLVVATLEGTTRSSIAREILEAELKRRYPDITKKVENLLRGRRRKRRRSLIKI